jgi:hypothetical protein
MGAVAPPPPKKINFLKKNVCYDTVVNQYNFGYCRESVQFWIVSWISTILDTVVNQYNFGYCRESVQFWILSWISTILDSIVNQYNFGYCRKSVQFCTRAVMYRYFLGKMGTATVSIAHRMFFLSSSKSVSVWFVSFAFQVSAQIKSHALTSPVNVGATNRC